MHKGGRASPLHGKLAESLTRRCGYWGQFATGDDTIDDAVAERLFGFHDVIAINVAGDSLNGLARSVGQNLVQGLAHAQDFFGVDVDIGRLSSQTAH